jgi:CRP/FNR family cyclic AMP-dependent transcriptional regulator
MNLTELFRFETEWVAVAAGQALFRAGEPGHLMYVLMTGTAIITVGTITVERAEPGAIVGEQALIESTPRSATVTAEADCQFLPIDAKRFQFLVQQTPNFSLHVMKVMSDRLRRTGLMLREASAPASHGT